MKIQQTGRQSVIVHLEDGRKLRVSNGETVEVPRKDGERLVTEVPFFSEVLPEPQSNNETEEV